MLGMAWYSVSQECKDLILKLLTKRPQDRLTPESARRHPWFASSGK